MRSVSSWMVTYIVKGYSWSCENSCAYHARRGQKNRRRVRCSEPIGSIRGNSRLFFPINRWLLKLAFKKRFFRFSEFDFQSVHDRKINFYYRLAGSIEFQFPIVLMITRPALCPAGSTSWNKTSKSQLPINRISSSFFWAAFTGITESNRMQ